VFFRRCIALLLFQVFQVAQTSGVVILSEAKNLRSFSGIDATNNQRCFASLNMTLVVIDVIYACDNSSSEANALQRIGRNRFV
jgi:hypothetical protein